MAIIHEQDGKKYLIHDGKYREIADTRNKAFFKGKMFDMRDHISDFLSSDLETCIVPVYCDNVHAKKGYRKVTLATNNEEYNFASFERGQYSFYRNEVMDVEKGNAYFIYLEKFGRAQNDCLIKAAMKI